MIYYTSDLHFGHENIIRMCNRPFADIDEMDEALIENWNATVHNNDTVYIMGDLIFKASRSPVEYLSRLKGKKHLILGNHDKTWVGDKELHRFFEEITRLTVINTGAGLASLCHFPMMDFEGRYLVHGHIHASTDDEYWSLLKASDRTLNAGVDINGYRPVTFEELLANNKRFKETH